MHERDSIPFDGVWRDRVSWSIKPSIPKLWFIVIGNGFWRELKILLASAADPRRMFYGPPDNVSVLSIQRRSKDKGMKRLNHCESHIVSEAALSNLSFLHVLTMQICERDEEDKMKFITLIMRKCVSMPKSFFRSISRCFHITRYVKKTRGRRGMWNICLKLTAEYFLLHELPLMSRLPQQGNKKMWRSARAARQQVGQLQSSFRQFYSSIFICWLWWNILFL